MKAILSSAQRENLSDSAFACPEKRLYPIHDAAHVRAALSRIADPNNDQCGKAKIMSAARKFGIETAKALLPIKAAALDPDEEEAFWSGKHPRRLLAIPFGGPIPSPKSKLGVDLDGEWFSQRTDIYGTYPELRTNRERLVDWHHSYQPPGPGYGDPSGMMRGHLIGKSILDPNPDEDGWWVDFWVREGDKRVALIRRVAERGAQLYGSSQPAKGAHVADDGEITVWPFLFETLSTSPQNTLSVMRAKALLDGANESEIDLSAGIRSLIGDLDALSVDLSPTSPVREETAKAARVSSFLEAVDRLEEVTRH